MKTQKRHPWRALFTLIFIFVLGTASLVVGKLTNKGASYTPSLALDLQGGTQLILTPVSTGQGDREVTESDITEAINIIRQRIDASGVSESEISSLGSSNISVSIPGTPSQETLDLIRSSSQMNFRPVLAMVPAVKQSEGTPRTVTLLPPRSRHRRLRALLLRKVHRRRRLQARAWSLPH